jgi:subtilisin family serine protease
VKRTAISLAAAAAALVANLTGAAAATSYPNDYFFVEGDQWALTGSAASIHAPAAWCASTGAGIVVADVDTGANFGHPDLAGKLIAGAQFLGGTAPDSAHPTGTGQAAVQDDNGHGSMTTGIMVADTANGQGVAAVAPDARALIVKVLDSSGSGYSNDVANGIRWAADHGANVINLSIGPGDVTINTPRGSASVGPPDTGTAITNAVSYAASKGVAVAVASGNSAMPSASYLTMEQQGIALVVGATGPDGHIASYSNYGYGVSVYAPGGDAPSQAGASVQNMVVSTGLTHQYPEYLIGEGTSFAAPQVGGVLAQLMATGRSAKQAMSAVLNSSGTTADGGAQLDAAAALGRARTAVCGTPTTSGTVAPPGGVTGPGGRHESVPPPPPPAPTAPPRPSTPPPPTAAASPTPTGDVGGVAQSGNDTQAGGHSAPPAVPSGGNGGGASPNPLLLATLAGVIVVGAPAAAWLVRAMRPPPP